MGGLFHMDCLEGLRDVPEQSVDLVFADLPYGRTANSWDEVIPVEALWSHLARVCKERTPMVFTAIQPFTSLLVCSKPKWFRYEMVWKKNKPRGFLNANKQPLRVHESILVFYRKQPAYRPQKTKGHAPVNSFTKNTSDGTNYGNTKRGFRGGGSTERYPTSILEIPVVNNDDPRRIHPTQKPEALPAWFIATYTKRGDLVLDPTAGSGSTLLAAKKMGRAYLGFERDKDMVKAARKALRSFADAE